jgi:CRISPR-associated protein Csx17
MPERHTHSLEGCRPTPLASYLKALGILRLVAEQNDPSARGWWHADRFQLRTTLDREALVRFFLEEYRPTPIIAPWNGGSGFYFRERKSKEKDPETGKRAKLGVRDEPTAATKTLTAVEQSTCARLAAHRRAISKARALLVDLELTAAPSDDDKERLFQLLRSRADTDLLAWLDTAAALLPDGAKFPPLLGTGGNDGNLDFSSNFLQRISELFALETGEPTAVSRELLESALLGGPTASVDGVAIGQFAPADAGGLNSTAGFSGGSRVNGWDYVLTLEGALVFAGGVSRRLDGADSAFLSYPFTFRAAAAGFGSASLDELGDTRGEVWIPIWTRPTAFQEIRALFREGRLSLGARPARDGLDAARAVGSLASDRGIVAFERYGFVKRFGKNYLATPLGRRFAAPNPAGELLTDLDRGGWLERLRTKGTSDDAPAAVRSAVRSLEDAIFALLERKRRPRDVQETLMALGRAVRCVALRPKLQEMLAPPPQLSTAWVIAADDGSPELRLALALAALRMGHGKAQGEANADVGTEGERGEVNGTGQSGEAAAGVCNTVDLTMCAHLGPLDPDSRLRSPRWAGDGKRAGEGRAVAVWGAGSFVDNLCAVAQRRLIEQRRRGLDQVPLDGAYGVGSGDIRAFLDGGVDDARLADLLLGLAWVSLEEWPHSKSEHAPLPFAYAALKPLFTPRRVIDRLKEDHRLPYEVGDLPVPPALPALLAGGRVAEAVRLGQQRAQASGLPAPFLDPRSGTAGRPFDAMAGRRLLAALVIPVNAGVVRACLDQAYPSDVREPVHASTEEEPHDVA